MKPVTRIVIKIIEIKIPKDIMEYRTKIVSGFDIRQTASIAISGVISFIIYRYNKDQLSIDLISNIVIPVILPILILGFAKYENLYADEYMFLMIKFLFDNPRTRVFQEYDIEADIEYGCLEDSKEMKMIKKELESERPDYVKEASKFDNFNGLIKKITSEKV